MPPHYSLCIPSHLQHAAVARVELSLAAQQAGHEEVKEAPQLLHVCGTGMGREGGSLGRWEANKPLLHQQSLQA